MRRKGDTVFNRRWRTIVVCFFNDGREKERGRWKMVPTMSGIFPTSGRCFLIAVKCST